MTGNAPADSTNGLTDPPLSSEGTPINDAFRGGPPAYPNVRDGTHPGFNGYPLGFTTFVMTPVAGTYALSVNVPSGNHPSVTLSAPNATLSHTTGLPTFAAAPVFTEDGSGGGTVTCTPPSGTTETLVEIEDENDAAFYTIVNQGGGAVNASLPDSLGPTSGSGTAPSIGKGDPYNVVCIAADYPLFEAGPPVNREQTPTLTAPGGQADIAFSPPLGVSGYSGTAAVRKSAAQQLR